MPAFLLPMLLSRITSENKFIKNVSRNKGMGTFIQEQKNTNDTLVFFK